MSVKFTPVGSEPVSLSAGAGNPVVVTVKVPVTPMLIEVLFALVIAGAAEPLPLTASV